MAICGVYYYSGALAMHADVLLQNKIEIKIREKKSFVQRTTTSHYQLLVFVKISFAYNASFCLNLSLSTISDTISLFL
jgi:CRISPR/Cas system-associated endonuclease Cas3-HD